MYISYLYFGDDPNLTNEGKYWHALLGEYELGDGPNFWFEVANECVWMIPGTVEP